MDTRFKTFMEASRGPAMRKAGRGMPSGEAQIAKLIVHTTLVAAIYGADAEQFVLVGTDPRDNPRSPA